jgi:transcriptional regulator with XRE-family HTH domain
VTFDAGRDTSAGQLDLEALGSDLRQLRQDTGQSVRQAAAAAEVSFMTFSRVESGSQPDLATFIKLCAWLGNPPETYFFRGPDRSRSTVDDVTRHLRADPRLKPDAARRIAEVVRDLYAALATEPSPPPPIACHLRAAGLLRPGVADRLGPLLRDMHARLEAMNERGAL